MFVRLSHSLINTVLLCVRLYILFNPSLYQLFIVHINHHLLSFRLQLGSENDQARAVSLGQLKNAGPGKCRT